MLYALIFVYTERIFAYLNLTFWFLYQITLCLLTNFKTIKMILKSCKEKNIFYSFRSASLWIILQIQLVPTLEATPMVSLLLLSIAVIMVFFWVEEASLTPFFSYKTKISNCVLPNLFYVSQISLISLNTLNIHLLSYLQICNFFVKR